jgi:hypothetical protein
MDPLDGLREYRPPLTNDDVVGVFYVTHANTPQQLQEIATTIRSVAGIRRLFVYSPRFAVAIRGTNQQMALATWLVNQLNQPANVAAPEPHEYKLSGDDAARVFELKYPQNPQQLQQFATLIRAVGDVQRLFVCNVRRALALRGSAEQISLATWLVNELDKPVNGSATPDSAGTHEYQLSSGSKNVVRIFYLSSSQDQQKLVNHLRGTTGIPRMFVYGPIFALAVRGTAGQLATAERALEEIQAR